MKSELISSHLIFLHGLSGAGKSVLQKALEEAFSNSGFNPIYLSSGDCFRALAELDAELSKKISSGNFIQTLEGTMPLLKKTIKTFLKQLNENKKPVLILDGFLRRGEFEVEGKTIPSQIDQVGDAFPIKNASDEIVKKAWHCYVDVNDIDAEALMRIRSDKHLKIIINVLDSKENEKIEKLREFLNKAFEIQANPKFRLKKVPQKLHEKLDDQMKEIVRGIFELSNTEYKEGISLAKPIEEIIGEKVTIRDDDLTFKRRLKRIEEFNVNTKNGVIKEIKNKNKDRFVTIKNGPSRGINLEILEKKCLETTKEMVFLSV